MKYLLLCFGIVTFIVFCKEPLAEEKVSTTPIAISKDSLKVEPFASIRLDKQNTVYIGFDNPVSINTYGLNPWLFEITTSPGATFRGGDNGGVLRVLDQGGHTITARYKDQVVEEFTVIGRRIPDPTAYLGNATSGEIEAEAFKAIGGIYALVPNMHATCRITGYRLLRVSASNDRSRSLNRGGNFDESTLPIIQQAAPGDIYQFTGVKAKCPGDKVSRQLNPLAFEIR